MIVVDASVLATALGDDGPAGDRVRDRLRGERMVAPELIDLEVASVWRRLVRAGSISVDRAMLAFRDLARVRLQRVSHRPLLPRVWSLRDTLTTYDAAYVALAEAIAAPLLTSDGRMSRASGVRCTVEVVA